MKEQSNNSRKVQNYPQNTNPMATIPLYPFPPLFPVQQAIQPVYISHYFKNHDSIQVILAAPAYYPIQSQPEVSIYSPPHPYTSPPITQSPYTQSLPPYSTPPPPITQAWAPPPASPQYTSPDPNRTYPPTVSWQPAVNTQQVKLNTRQF